jgi:hypothetical protein
VTYFNICLLVFFKILLSLVLFPFITRTKRRRARRMASRVFTEVTFWNFGEFEILCGSDFTSAEFFTVYFRGIS